MKVILRILFLFLITKSYSQDFKVDYYFGEKSAYNLTILDSNVWIGGYLGVVKLNKYDFNKRELITDPFVSFKQNWCFQTKTYKNSNGLLYFSTSDLYKYEDKELLLQKDFEYGIVDVYIDVNNVIWLITGNWDEIIRIENDNITKYNSSNSALPDYQYNCLSVNNHNIWLGTLSNGIVKFNYSENEITEFNSNNSELPYDQISCIKAISDTIWIGCHTYGIHPDYDEDYTLVCFHGTDWSIYNRNNSDLPSTIIKDIYYNNGKTYLCTTNGLVIKNKTNWEFYNKANSNLNTNNINSVAIDEKKIWICSDEGVSLIKEDSIYNIDLHDMPFSGIFQGPIAEDLDGNIWIGTSGTFGNLCKYDGQSWKEVLPKGTMNNAQSFYGITVDNNNVIWATVYSHEGGVYRIEGDSIVKFDETNSVVPSFSEDIIVDTQNNKWILSDWKILKYDDSTWTVFDYSEYPILKLPNSIACDNDGNIWVGVHQSGMVKYDGHDWTHYDDSFFGNEYSEVNKIIVDKENNLWIDYSHGTIEPKLCKFDGSNLTWFDSNINLPSKGNGLMAVEENGDIWYHSDDGLFKYNGIEWIDYSSQNTRLLNNQCWEIFIDSRNNKWISSDCYIAKFNEDSIYIDTLDDNDVITNNSSFIIFPNPLTNGLITIKSTNFISEELLVQIYDLSGNIAYENRIQFDSEKTLDIFLNNGLYILRINSKTKSEVYKLLINKP